MINGQPNFLHHHHQQLATPTRPMPMVTSDQLSPRDVILAGGRPTAAPPSVFSQQQHQQHQNWLEAAAAANLALRQNFLAAAALPQLLAASLAPSGLAPNLSAPNSNRPAPNLGPYAGFFGSALGGHHHEGTTLRAPNTTPAFMPMESAFVAARYR